MTTWQSTQTLKREEESLEESKAERIQPVQLSQTVLCIGRNYEEKIRSKYGIKKIKSAKIL